MSKKEVGIYRTLENQESLRDSILEFTETFKKNEEYSKNLSTCGQKKILKTLINNYKNEGEMYEGLREILEDVEEAERDENFMNPAEFTRRISSLQP